MATIYKRKRNNGNISYYINLTCNGKRIRKYVGDSLKIAKQSLKKLEYEYTFNPDIVNDDILLDNAVNSFIYYLLTTNIKQSQIKAISSKIMLFINHSISLGVKDLSDIKPNHSISYINMRMNTKTQSQYMSFKESIYTPLKPNTINREIGFIKRFFNYCIDMEWISKNPFRTIKYLKIDNKKDRYYFSKDEIERILKRSNKYRDFYILLLKTGLRATDAYKLKRKHIKGSYISLKMNKTNDYIYIPISNKVIAIVNKRLGDEYIFPELQSNRQRKNCVKFIQGLFDSEYVRINNINLHSFRHTFAHNLLDKGLPKEILQTLLGHRSIKTTEIYANWINKDKLSEYVHLL
tara:strand:- start:615 stop:1664 length:1050 start_codon:yes stop_codon:yes gene_type:complete